MRTPPGPARLRDKVVAGPGGAMTDEVGVITGDLTITTTARPDGLADIAAEYTGAEETYTLTGSPVPVPPAGLRALHDQALAAVRAGRAAQAPRT
ncbi:hypothetical protein [Streptomyces fuscichromogenes]|uniref:Uncharacterized protein n=1 Tax=Streptomyces fuscichromogenes TaxID=1324013 RepID=A0A917XPM0_9ACTN|nr:hypothetical protein [Streptomyces fuscichromogenes]GGN45812.1 hypothetical protein GCM10011578_098110 [Streptomyces fuscichromogenes]